MTSRKSRAEILCERLLEEPELWASVVDLADGSVGRVVHVNADRKNVHATFSGKTNVIPWRSLSGRGRRLVWKGVRESRLSEGRGEPGFDVPWVYRVKVRFRGKTYVKDIECRRKKDVEWAQNRAVASVLRQFGLTGSQLRLAIYKLKRDGQVSSSDYSTKADPMSGTYVPLSAGARFS